jgi:hypothetical protein
LVAKKSQEQKKEKFRKEKENRIELAASIISNPPFLFLSGDFRAALCLNFNMSGYPNCYYSFCAKRK